ncbi:FAD-binding oxidoreductase, partial [Vibrio splendidus]|uniref:FAD-binding oxidoreductase n=1 Tax=Vibrio splendidus TaxID=29497 RepID=UPI000D4AEA12
MLPRLQLNADVDPVVVRFLDELKTAGFTGDIESQYSSRLAVATDNSVYQQLPQAVILPKTTQDVVLLGQVGAKSAYERVTFSPRGGGTGTNGQSLTKGVVVDLSRHMNKVLEINEKEGWVRVQSGVVKDQLNDAVRPYGYFFSPDLSTSNRATLGGMINTDASGQGSLKYGKTSDHVLSLQAVFADGSCLESDLSHGLPVEGEFAHHALAVTEAVCRDKRAQILNKFPPLNRFLTGYDLKNAINEQDDSFDLTRVLCGAEGSTSNRATLGGMINTDASGQGSLKYGKTSDHVLSLQAVFADGSCLESDLSHGLPVEGEFAHHALAVTEAVCRDKRAQILNKFPPLNRFLTGYDLKNAINEQDDSFDLTRVLCGAEGSLAFITEAKLNLTPIPKARTLVNVKYNTFDSALRNAPFMVEAKALSVETVDSRVLNLAKQDIVWHTVSDLLMDVPNKEMLGINMVEFAGQDEAEVEQQVQALTAQLESMLETEEAGVIGFQVCSDLASIGRIYNMRKKAVGLLGAAKGRAKPVAFAEDTCVPPENLADFISEFRVLLDSKELNYGMFGHVDAGVLHVRPALDLCDPMQEALMHEVSDEVVKLVAKYGGLMWGEHGKGFRSEYGPDFFGEELFTELRRVKAAFDPHNKMNPGKICTPLESDAELVKVTDTKRGFYDRQIDVQVRDSFKQAMECNGNGL